MEVEALFLRATFDLQVMQRDFVILLLSLTLYFDQFILTIMKA